MKFFAVAALFAGALAMPTAEIEARTDHDGGHGGHGGSSYQPCLNGLFSNPVCAATDVLGLLCLDATVPSIVPRNAAEFKENCAASGRAARCAVLPVAEQAVLCALPVGVSR